MAEEFLAREAASWDAFRTQFRRVPDERLNEPGVVGDWSTKDVVWHCAAWARFAADHLETPATGPFVDPFDGYPDEHWDAVNAEIATASSAMTWEAVRAGAEDARTSVRNAVATDAASAEAIEWAADETFVHYDEHAEHVRAFIEGG